MTDPYDTLGLRRDASPEEIKKAYRRLARTSHPDNNQGDVRAEERFKGIAAAYELLSDPVKRSRFDRGEIDATGHERGRPGRQSSGFAGDDPFGADIFAEYFGRRRAKPGPEMRRKGIDANYSLTVSFEDAVIGATRRLSLTNGKTLDVRIAPGTESGQKLRLKGQGTPGLGGGGAGDAIIEIEVESHPHFTRKGYDIYIDVPVTLKEAVLGARITVPTVAVKVTMTVPPGSNTDTVLRLKGKGIEHPGGQGDQMVRLKVMLPDGMDRQLETFVKQWSPVEEDDPREKVGMI